MATDKIFIFASEKVKNAIIALVEKSIKIDIYHATDSYSAQQDFTGDGIKRAQDYQLIILDSAMNLVAVDQMKRIFIEAPKSQLPLKQYIHMINYDEKATAWRDEVSKILQETFPGIKINKINKPAVLMRSLLNPPVSTKKDDKKVSNKNASNKYVVKNKESVTSLTPPNSPPKANSF